MADGKRSYEIVINGVKESVDAIDSLNKQLDALEKKIDSLSSKAVNVSASSNGTGKKSSVSALSEEEKLTRQILQLDEKREVYQQQLYQSYLASKDLLKETLQDQKQLAASERLTADQYTNTMAGMKQQLADIKAVMQTVDLSDTDQFDKLTQKANELTNKLKEIEESYGQFGRNVGNYANGVAEGIAKYKIQVGDTVREFDSARQAAKELTNELLNLPKGAEGAQDLRKAIQSIKSDIKDLATSSNVMDNLLDTMQSFTAIASVGEGISAFFGIDNSAMEETIQKLVALQNVMQGLEQLNQQMNTGEGLMGWLSKGNDMIDSFVSKLTGASNAQKTLNDATNAGAKASKGLAAAETAQAAATSTATVATKALSIALKAIGIGLVISAVAALITYWKDIYKWLTDTVPVLKNLSTWFDKIRAVAVGVGTVIINYLVQPFATLVKVIQALINGNFAEIPKIISDGLKKTFNAAGNFQKGYYKETERQQEKHLRKVREAQKKANEEQLKDEEAKYGKSHQRTQEYYKKQMALVKEGSDEYRELQRKLWEDERAEREENERKKTSGSTLKAIREREDLVKKAEEDLTNITLEMMRDGLTKELAQLDYNNKKKIEEIEKNYKGQDKIIEKLKGEQNKLYAKQREDILIGYGVETTKLIDENAIKEFKNEIDSLNMIIEDKMKSRPAFIQPVSSEELKAMLASYKVTIEEAKNLYDEFVQENAKKTLVESKEVQEEILGYYGDFIHKFGTEIEKEEFGEKFATINLDGIIDKEKWDETLVYLRRFWESRYQLAIRYGDVFKSLEKNDTNVLSDSLRARMTNEYTYLVEMQKVYEEYTKKRLEKEKQALETERKMRDEELIAQANRLDTEINNLKARRANTTDKSEINKIDQELDELERRHQAVLNEQSLLAEEYVNKIVSLERKTIDTLRELTERGFGNFASHIRDYLTEIDKLEGKQPIYNAFGFINYSATKKQYDEIKNAAVGALGYIDTLREDLLEKFQKGLITPEARSQIEKQLNSLEISVNTRLESVERKSKELPLELYKQIDAWIQHLGQAATQIIQSIGQINDAAFEKQMEALEKQTEALEEQLNKQKELTQKYADDVEGIEDELSTARGDRRQHLIDQLNAQMQAQRESLAQEKAIEKEQERMEKKKEKMEEENNKRRKAQAITTALINAALAISNAAVNKWPIPALPMIAFATAVGAAQVAAVRAAKYADGGVLVGKSHRQGGIKTFVGGRPIELEGNEYVIRKATTTKNIDLLDYINKSERKLDLSDFIDFYSSGKIRKNMHKIDPKTKYADGGYIPTLRTDIDINDRVVNAMERYADKPTYVSVVDIINKSDDVRRVQTLAGLE